MTSTDAEQADAEPTGSEQLRLELDILASELGASAPDQKVLGESETHDEEPPPDVPS